jgi:kynurenine formamidase
MTEPSRTRRVIDLSHVITDGMVTYPGIPAPVIGAHLTFEESASHYAAGTEFSIGTISMAANTGTYLDISTAWWPGCGTVRGPAVGRSTSRTWSVPWGRFRRWVALC